MAYLEYRKATDSRKFKRSSPHDIQLLSINIKLLRGVDARGLQKFFWTTLSRFYSIKHDVLLWFFKLGCVKSLIWDLRERESGLFSSNAPFFGYLDKRCKRCNLTNISTNLGQLALLNFIQMLGLGEDNSKLFINRLWWNSRPHLIRNAYKQISLGENFKFVWCCWNIFANERKTNTFNWCFIPPLYFLELINLWRAGLCARSPIVGSL